MKKAVIGLFVKDNENRIDDIDERTYYASIEQSGGVPLVLPHDVKAEVLEKFANACDGKEISRCNERISHVPQFLLLTTEVMGHRWSEERKKSADRVPRDIVCEFVDDAFIVDFVRVFDKIG